METPYRSIASTMMRFVPFIALRCLHFIYSGWQKAFKQIILPCLKPKRNTILKIDSKTKMATRKSSFYARSISLAFKSHPYDLIIEYHLRRLTTAEASPSFSSSICQNLFGIKDLYKQMNNWIHSQCNKNALYREEIEEGPILDLKLALQRGSEDDVDAYLTSRKKVIKLASKFKESREEHLDSFKKWYQHSSHLHLPYIMQALKITCEN
ncbi:hypothetical protein Cgig2_004219 [Carnegiea gigantea]|uniref:Uncharacterized protein n=1 Tax=Carnegiea gigantea TaxID=171969 RepID=A0A9Q1GX47_9CARY|nr:hypothetical protein Cgig2_004219 [Carnegiea gigantea]